MGATLSERIRAWFFPKPEEQMVSVEEIDKHLEFLRAESRSLSSMGKPWAEAKAAKLDQLIALLRNVRQDIQMTGVGGKRLA